MPLAARARLRALSRRAGPPYAQLLWKTLWKKTGMRADIRVIPNILAVCTIAVTRPSHADEHPYDVP